MASARRSISVPCIGPHRPILSSNETNYTRCGPQLIRVAGLADPPVGIESSALNGFVPALSFRTRAEIGSSGVAGLYSTLFLRGPR